MTYKVFLVEDEIITREGIRDNVDWGAAGFEFCGEAADGEIALPLIEETQPDVLITDIKMPFMDGLQLSKIVREHMPWIKIIILSGHDEFNYAQSAVKLGVTDYLLKPISAQDLRTVLKKLTTTLDREKQQREKLKTLETRVEDSLNLAREKFLLKLVMGGISSAEAIEQSQPLGLDILAKHYMVVFIRIELCDPAQAFDYHEYQHVERIIKEFASNNLDGFLTKKDMEELILLLTSEDQEQLVEEGRFLADLIKKEVEKNTTCNPFVDVGSPVDRIGDIHHSFAQAISKSRSMQAAPAKHNLNMERIDKIKIDHGAIENYLQFGSIQDFEIFFSTTIEPLARSAMQSYLIKHYLFVDIVLTATKFVTDLGAENDCLIPDLQEIEDVLENAVSVELIQSEIKRIFSLALEFRKQQANPERSVTLQQARAYVDDHFTNPDLKMSDVADNFNISPSHFSTIFSQEIGVTFRDYLSKLRINHAKTLLRTTNLQCSEVAYHSGFNDSHYFSYAFKKKTGKTPQQFRDQPSN